MPSLDRDRLLDAFDAIGKAARTAETKIQIAVYGGSALLLASNFRFSTEDVDVQVLDGAWPAWLKDTVERIGAANRWSDDWFNDGVVFHLSAHADKAADHLEFGTFPRDAEEPGLVVLVPSAEYLLALKLKAVRVLDPNRGEQERLDILNLMNVVGTATPDAAIDILIRYFPISGFSAEKQRFLLKYMSKEGMADAPKYPR